MRNNPPGGGGGSLTGLLLGVAGFVGTLLLLALITAVVIYLYKRRKGHLPGRQHAPVPPAQPSALQILDERLARSEIEIADYLDRRTALLGNPPRPNEWTPGADHQPGTAQPSGEQPTP